MFTCVICGKDYKHKPYNRTYLGTCIHCTLRKLIPIATAAEMVSICGGFTRTPTHTLRRIYKSLEVANVDKDTFVQMVRMFMGPRIDTHMEKKYSIPNN